MRPLGYFIGVIAVGIFLARVFSDGGFSSSKTMPSLAQEAQLAPPEDASHVTFKPDSWACPYKLLPMQIKNDKQYYGSPHVRKMNVQGSMVYCVNIKPDHEYRLLRAKVRELREQAKSQSENENRKNRVRPPKITMASPCPDKSCVGFQATRMVNGQEVDVTLYAPNSFIAETR